MTQDQWDRVLRELRELRESIDRLVPQKLYYNSAETAQILGKALWTTLQYLRTGALRGERSRAKAGPFNKWVVARIEIERFLQEGPYHYGEVSDERDGEAPGAAGCPVRPKNSPKAPPTRRQPELA